MASIPALDSASSSHDHDQNSSDAPVDPAGGGFGEETGSFVETLAGSGGDENKAAVDVDGIDSSGVGLESDLSKNLSVQAVGMDQGEDSVDKGSYGVTYKIKVTKKSEETVVVVVDGIDDGSVEKKESMDGAGIEEDADLNKAEGSGVEDKSSDVVASGLDPMEDSRSGVADAKDEGGDSLVSKAELVTIQGADGTVNETELMDQIEDTPADIKDSVTGMDVVSPPEVVEGSQPEGENFTPGDLVAHSTDGDNEVQAGETGHLKEEATNGDSQVQIGEPGQSKEAEATNGDNEVQPGEPGQKEGEATDGDNEVQAGEPGESKGAEAVESDTSSRYYMPLQDEKIGFSTTHLVWGKVKSHPWWPGEIFDPSHASEMALNYKKEGRFLIAYFGDKTFAWNDETQLKTFFTHYREMEKQTNHVPFANAINSALEEVTRRVEVGLTCKCFADEAYDAMMKKTVVNAGLREGTCTATVDTSLIASYFQPGGLLHYVKSLAEDPCGGVDRLELATLKAQLKAFCHSKSYPWPHFHIDGEGLVENDSEASPPGRKQKSRGRGSSKDGKKERKLSELMEEDKPDPVNATGKAASRSSSRKRKAPSHYEDTPHLGGSKKRRRGSVGGLEGNTTSPRSAKVGERISRVASQMTGSPPIIKSSSMVGQKRGRAVPETSKSSVVKAYSSTNEVLSQLCLAAGDPMKGYGFQSTLTNFITGFRESICSKDAGSKRGKRKSANAKAEMPPDYIQDSYWSDVVFHDLPEEGEEAKEQEPTSSGDNKTGRSQSRQRKKKMKLAGEEPTLAMGTQQEVGEERTADGSEQCTPTSLILSFTESDTLPSGADLITIFSRFGPLEEAETEVMEEEKRAKVVFRKRADAEAAYDRSGKDSLFGPALVSYRLK